MFLAGCLTLAAVSARAAEVPTTQAAPPAAAASSEAAAVPATPSIDDRLADLRKQRVALAQQMAQGAARLNALDGAIEALGVYAGSGQ